MNDAFVESLVNYEVRGKGGSNLLCTLSRARKRHREGPLRVKGGIRARSRVHPSFSDKQTFPGRSSASEKCLSGHPQKEAATSRHALNVFDQQKVQFRGLQATRPRYRRGRGA